MAPSLDQQLFLLLNADRGRPWADTLWAVLSSLHLWLPLLIAGGLLIAWRGGFRGRAMLACLLLSIGIMEGGIINPLKKTISKQRPYHVLSEARVVKLEETTPRWLAAIRPPVIRAGNPAEAPALGKSLPSGHTSNMFCFATVLTVFYRWRGALFFIPATLVALSRVATGSHWPSDILLSAPGSVIVTLLLLAVYSWLWRTLAPRLVPTLAARHPQLIAPV
jgi:undecaprenyl-diphosphatase